MKEISIFCIDHFRSGGGHDPSALEDREADEPLNAAGEVRSFTGCGQ